MKASALLFALILGSLGCNFAPHTDYPLRGLPIAKHAIPAGKVIHEDDIRILEIPKEELDAPEVPHKLSQVVGHKALEDIPKTGGILLTRISQ
jgi:flagella basal body P-ring formation protein FlgA